MRVFVAGATGVVGQFLVPSLVAAGHEVTGTTRSTAKAADAASRRRDTRHRRRPGPPGRAGRGQGGAARGDRAPDDRPGQHEQLPQLRQGVRGHQRAAHQGHRLPAGSRAAGGHPPVHRAELRRLEQHQDRRPGQDRGRPARPRSGPVDPQVHRRRSGTSRRPCPARSPRAWCCATARSTATAPRTTCSTWCASGRCPLSAGARASGRSARSPTPPPRPPRRSTVARPAIYNIVDDDPAPVREWLPYLAECIGAEAAACGCPAWLGGLLAGELSSR